MLDICCNVGTKYNLSINPSKPVCSVFGNCSFNSLPQLKLLDFVLKWYDKMTYLGVCFVFEFTLSRLIDINPRINKFYADVCAVLKERVLGFENVYVCLLILNKYLLILFYGLVSQFVSSKVLQALTKSWNTAFKWMFKLRKFGSTRLLLKSYNTKSAKFLLHRNLLLFPNNVSLSALPVLHNLWLWRKTCLMYNKLLSLYNLCDVNCKSDIYKCVASCFDIYCNIGDLDQ